MKIQTYMSSMRKLTVAIVTCLSLVSAANAASSPEEARDFVQTLGDKVIKIVADNASSVESKEKQLNEMFVKTVDTDWIAKFVAGRYWKDSTDVQQKKYIEGYNKYLLRTYVPKFKKYTGQKMTIGKFYTEGEGEYLVETTIEDKEGQSYNVSYKLKKLGSAHFKIYDIIAEGVSMITTQRSEFGSILAREGMDSLVVKLDHKG